MVISDTSQYGKAGKNKRERGFLVRNIASCSFNT